MKNLFITTALVICTILGFTSCGKEYIDDQATATEKTTEKTNILGDTVTVNTFTFELMQRAQSNMEVVITKKGEILDYFVYDNTGDHAAVALRRYQFHIKFNETIVIHIRHTGAPYAVVIKWDNFFLDTGNHTGDISPRIFFNGKGLLGAMNMPGVFK